MADLNTFRAINLAHVTSVPNARRIIESGVFSAKNALGVEKGANFFPTPCNNFGVVIEEKRQCVLVLKWYGPVVEYSDGTGLRNVIYDYGNWMYIDSCNKGFLVFESCSFLANSEKHFECTLLERLRFGSRRQACARFFEARYGKQMAVDPQR